MVQLSQRALTASDADAALFADRAPELERIRRALGLGFNVYLLGPPGSGLTSLLRHVQRGLDATAIYVNAAGPTSLSELSALVAGSLAGPPVMDPSGAPLASLRTAAVERSAGGSTTVLLDGVRHDLRHQLFGRQRDELWEIPLRWVVTGHAPLVAPADAFFETTVRLKPFGEEAMRELLGRRGRGAMGGSAADPAQSRQLDRLAERLPPILGEAWPRQVLSAARMVMLSDEPDAAMVALREQRRAQGRLSDTASRVLDALGVLGPVHAGDERLLEEIGTTRSRITQVLKELEATGLVTSERSGRRRLYAPVPASFAIDAHIAKG